MNPAATPPVDRVVTLLRDYIAQQQLQPGDQLPAVRQLADHWRVGRNVVRDGLLRAQTLGIVEVKPRSGVVVRRPDHQALLTLLADSLAPFVAAQHPSLVHLWQTRAILESETVAVAARRRVPEDLQRLRQLITAMDRTGADRARFVEIDEEFHLVIARAMANPVVVTLLQVLLKLLRPDRLHARPSPDRQDRTAASHRAIYRALAAGDPAGAAAAMAEHLENRVRFLIQLDEPVAPPA